jgi:hypothetical protein
LTKEDTNLSNLKPSQQISQPLSRIDPNKPKIIRQINMAGTVFDICADKDWDTNDPENKDYVANRTHFKENVVYTAKENIPEKGYTKHDDNLYRATDELPDSISHEFVNTYTMHEAIQTVDWWQITEPWFRPGGKYEVSIMLFGYNNNETMKSEVTFNTNAEQKIYISGQDGPYILFVPATREFRLADEPRAQRAADETYKAEYPTSVANSFTIRPIQDEHYNGIVNQLDAEYIPIDNKTIRRKDGKLFIDDTFDKDFYVSAPFGKYPAQTWVSAANKTTREVLMEAFAERLQPGKPIDPQITFTVSGGGNKEIGSKVDLTWTLKLNPGKYTYGTIARGDSNIWVEKAEIYGFTADSTFKVTGATETHKTTSTEPLVLLSETSRSKYLESLGANTNGLTADSFTIDTNPCLALTQPAASNIRYPEGGGQGDTVITGTIKVPVTKEDSHGTAYIKVKYNRLDSAPSADVTMTEASYITTGPVRIDTKNDSPDPEVQAAYDATASSGSINGQYRWFWRYFDSNAKHELGNFGSTEADVSNCFRSNVSNCSLNTFPTSVKTTKMKYIYFAAPIASSKKVNYNEPKDFILTNTKINAPAGSIKRLLTNNLDPNSSPRIIKIADAGGTLQEYEVFYLALDGADLDTNTYSLTYKTNK